jgi:GntR family transcriptional regulator / MocR family aminotransferase
MSGWQMSVQLADEEGPIFRRIVAAISGDITRGRLQRGERLPSSRALAGDLGINRNTVIAAYDELRASGWIEMERSRGVFVVGVPARAAVPPGGRPDAPGFTIADDLALELPLPRRPGLLLLLGGVPELRTMPHLALARAYRAAVASARRHLDYGHPQGAERLRSALGDLMSRVRGVPATAAQICVVRGSQHGVYLTARALLRPGDVVAIEELGYPPAWQALRLAGADLVTVPVDAGGLDVDALARLCETRPVRAVYLTPHHHYPTTVPLAAERRLALLELARRQRMIVIEDDYDYDFHFEGPPTLPLAAVDRAGVVVYLGTMSKVLAPGLRLGYVVAPTAVIQRIAAYRAYVDGQGDHALEHAIAILLEDGEVQRHARRARDTYRVRRDALCVSLARTLPQLLFAPPTGGMALWARAPGIDVDAWVRRGLEADVAFQSERRFRADDRPGDHLRLGFAACTPTELDLAVQRMAAALPADRISR